MLSKIKDFLKNTKEFRFFMILFIIYIGLTFLQYFIKITPFIFLQMCLGLFLAFIGTGFCVTIILQWLFKKTFDSWEFISISILGGLLVPAIFLTIEFFLFSKAYDWYPVANIFILLFFASILLFIKKTSFPHFSFSKINIHHPLFLVFIFGFIFSVIQVIFYSNLQDLDPYKWLLKYIYQFANQQLDYTERPFFGAFVFIGTRLANLEIFTFLKYILPFSFILTLAPAWMIARKFNDTKKQLIFLLFTFVSPVVLLYAQTAMPQAILITLSYFFIFFLIYSAEKKDDFFFYLSGITIFLSFFFHQAGIILFLVWIIIAFIAKFKIIFSDKKYSFLILLLFITNLSLFEKMLSFASSWINSVFLRIFSPNNLNLLYPAQYANVDRNSMGWGSISGVIKFYAFHMGPLLGGLLLLFLTMIIFNKSFRLFFLKKIKMNYPLTIGFSCFFIFFIIAEILPRFPNIALLPDRAWIFVGIFSFIFLFLILSFIKKVPEWIFYIFIFFLIIDISGALYINYLKKFLITPTQMQSAKWIKENLPADRIFISYGHKSLLPIHADTALIRISAETYCKKELNDFKSSLNFNENDNTKKIILEKYYKPFLRNFEEIITNAHQLQNDNPNNISLSYTDAKRTIDSISEEILSVKEALERKNKMPIIYPPSKIPLLSSPMPIEDVYELNYIESFDSIKKNPLYIYYAKQDKRNPYRGRPYEMTTWGIDPCLDGKFIFDLYPNNFKRIYSINDDEVIIWKILSMPN